MDYSDETMENIDAMLEPWYNDFVKSSVFNKLTERAKGNSGFIIPIFGDYMYNYESETPKQWSGASVEYVLSSLFPRKISADHDTYEDVEPVLTAFFSFLSDSNHIKNAAALTKAVKKASPVMLREATDSSNWGIAKSFMMGALESGVDVEDKQAMDNYMMQYNTNIMNKNLPKQPQPRLSTNPAPTRKIGKNEFCPCGSDKKYKRCCGA